MERRKYFRLKIILICALSVLICATLGFIWGNSLLPQAASAKESSEVYETVKPVVDTIVGENVVTHNVFRKLAHATEFFLLGAEIVALFVVCGCFRPSSFPSIAFCGLSCAVIDETIQNYTGRGPAVTDVLIDMAGFTFSAMIFISVAYLVKCILKRHSLSLKKKEE